MADNSARVRSVVQLRPGVAGLVRVCQSLARQGVQYDTVIERKHAGSLANCPRTNIQITIRAHGTPQIKRNKPKSVKFTPVAAITSDQITRRLTESQRAADNAKDGFVRNLKYQSRDRSREYEPTWKDRNERRRIGRAVAKIVARRKTKDPAHITTQDYAELDAVIGRKVERQSKISDRYLESGYLHWFVKRYAGSWRFNVKMPKSPATSEETRPNLGFAGCKPFYEPRSNQFNAAQAFLGAKADLEYWQEMARLNSEVTA